MDAVAPRASVINEINKKINGDINSNNSSKDYTTLNDNDAFISAMWDGAENTAKNSVEKSQLKSVENEIFAKRLPSGSRFYFMEVENIDDNA